MNVVDTSQTGVGDDGGGGVSGRLEQPRPLSHLMSDELRYGADKNSITINPPPGGGSFYRSEEDYYSSVFGGAGGSVDSDAASLIDNENEIILDGETQIRFLGNIRVWQLAATFLLACVLLMFVLIIVVKVINKIQKEKYLMLLMMEAKLGEIEKKSYTLLKSGLSHSLERISSISSRLSSSTVDYWRRRMMMCNNKSNNSSNRSTSSSSSRHSNNKSRIQAGSGGASASGSSTPTPTMMPTPTTACIATAAVPVESIYECPLSVSDLAYTNHCFKLDEYDANAPQLPMDSFA